MVDPIHLDMQFNPGYFPQITQNSDVVFLADKVWQGGGQSSVDMNFVAQQYNSNGMSLYDDKDRQKTYTH